MLRTKRLAELKTAIALQGDVVAREIAKFRALEAEEATPKNITVRMERSTVTTSSRSPYEECRQIDESSLRWDVPA